ncbi:glucose transporter GlcU [Lacticaseibacillus zeae]|uniref:Glucose transporter GlcU n=1 Tax=Lacticaseibacillus zeae TaxID=57037 RepID=A0A5R8LJ40_LACZE|nr:MULTISPECIES: GRP family sugar transporter [Lacticaseibacillus]KLI76219.1 glucose transporter GlcU [Lacticaseibacillus casei]TLF37254.1 glucose transporter GlcU [Lacticaseibacillus zeae]
MVILLALIPMFAWGSIGLVSGKLGGNAYQQTLGMTFGALVFGVGTLLVMHPALDSKTWLLGIISGLFWALGQGQQFQSMKYMGVSMTMPISTGMQLIATTLAGALLFHEWHNGRDVTLGILALVLLIIGATLTSRREQNDDVTSASGVSKGIRTLLISTAGYAGYTIIVNAGQLGALAVVMPQSVGMIIGALLMSIGHQPFAKATVKNILTGLLWGTGNVFMLLSMAKVGLAVSYSLSQMGIVISTFGSIYLLGERKTHKEMIWVSWGSALVILGGVVLGIMKAK